MSETQNFSTSLDIELNKQAWNYSEPLNLDKCSYFILLFIVGQLFCGVSSSLSMLVAQLSNHSLNMPFFNSFLGCFIILIYAKSGKASKSSIVKFVDYLLPTVFDSLGFILNQVAISKTTIASNDLMGSFEILVTTILSIIVFKLSYRLAHYLGICFTLVGMGVIYYLDSQKGQFSRGDLFGLMSSASWAISYVFQERVFKMGMQTHDYLAKSMLIETIIGICGFALTSEYQLMLCGNLTPIAILELSVYSIGNLALILLLMYILQNYGATSFSLISLCTVVYSTLYDIFLFGKPFRCLEVVGYASIITGVVVFHIKEPHSSKKDPLLGEKIE